MEQKERQSCQKYSKSHLPMPRVSVIVPVYNSELYLNQCVDSILAQTYSDYEVLLIDDGSTDQSSRVCDEYASMDSRVRTIHTANMGVSHARNVGIELACGEFIAFVDSDDYISSDLLLSLVQKMDADPELDFVQFSMDRFDEAGVFYKEESVSTTMILADFIESDNYIGSVCVSMMKTAIIQNASLRFNSSLKLGEDQAFVYEYLSHCRRCAKVSDIYYHYRSNRLSATNNPSPSALANSILYFKSCSYKQMFIRRIESLLFSLTFQLVVIPSMSIKDVYSLCKDIDFDNVDQKQRKLVAVFLKIDNVSRYLAIAITRFLNAVIKKG